MVKPLRVRDYLRARRDWIRVRPRIRDYVGR